MFKKLLGLILFLCVMLTLLNFSVYNSKPALGGIGYNLKVYATSNSSKIIELDLSRCKTADIKSETCEISVEDFNLEDILSSLNAKIVCLEEISEGVSYYAFSPKIKYRGFILGKQVNLHIFVKNSGVKIGSPLIYESF